MKGHAFIKHGKEVDETEFDPKGKSFKHDGKKYNVRGSGLFYWTPRWFRRTRLTSFYTKGKADPLTLDEPMPTVTAEELKIIDEESVTQRGFRSLRTPFSIPSRALLFIIIAIVVVAGVVWYTTMGPGAGGGEENMIRSMIP